MILKKEKNFKIKEEQQFRRTDDSTKCYHRINLFVISTSV